LSWSYLYDMDLSYVTSYSLQVFRLNKQVLKAVDVSFGINLVDQCVEFDNWVAEVLSSDNSRIVLNLDVKSKYPNLTRNQMQELSLMKVLNFLINQDIIDEETHCNHKLDHMAF
jgi:hypothetical protein